MTGILPASGFGPKVMVALCLVLSDMALAADQSLNLEKREITVRAHHEIEILPNAVHLELGTLTLHSNPDSSMWILQAKKKRMQNVFRDFGITEKQLFTQMGGIEEKYEHTNEGRKLLGFQSSVQYSLDYFALDSLSELMNRLYQIGCNRITSTRFHHTREDSIIAICVTRAQQNGRRQAEALAKLGGFRVGKMKHLSQNSPRDRTNYLRLEVATHPLLSKMPEKPLELEPFHILPQKLKFESVVHVQYGLVE